MKFQSTLAATLFAITAALALEASAATEQTAPAGTQKSEQQAEQKDQAKTCPCTEGKTAAAEHRHDMQSNQAATAKVNPMFDRSKHFHPRDGGKL